MTSLQVSYIKWYEYNMDSDPDQTVGIHALMPLNNKKLSSLKSQFYCMNIINFINQDQVPVDVSDQLVFALSKEVQIRYPLVFGPGKYFCLFDDLHIEQSLLGLHGEIIKGSGLETILEGANLSTKGVSTIVDVNDIKRSRCCLQVTVCALEIAHSSRGSDLSPLQWLEERSTVSQICFIGSSF